MLGKLDVGGVHVGLTTLWRVLKRQGISLEKTVFAIEQDRPNRARKRARWKKYQGRIDPSRLVFIDKTWAKTNTIHSHGWCARGKPLTAKATTATGAP